MSNSKPFELHILQGTKQRGKQKKAPLPDTIKKRIPFAEWMINPDSFDRQKFFDETVQFLWDAYGIGNEQDSHVLAMLADQVETYVECMIKIRQERDGKANLVLVVKQNDGKTVGSNPYLSIKNKTLTLIIQLMNELGLTPRARLSSTKPINANAFDEFLKGP